VGALEGYKFSDFFVRNGEVRKQDHAVIRESYLAQVKAPGDVKEPWDYVRILNTIPANEAFQPLSENTCHMARQRHPSGRGWAGSGGREPRASAAPSGLSADGERPRPGL